MKEIYVPKYIGVKKKTTNNRQVHGNSLHDINMLHNIVVDLAVLKFSLFLIYNCYEKKV